jgi:HK97 family phage major capsid protein
MENKQIIDQINSQFEEMKSFLNTRVAEEVKTFGAPLNETKAAIDGFNARLDALELKLQRPAAGRERGNVEAKGEGYNAFMKALRHGFESLDSKEAKALATAQRESKLMTVADGTTGGFGAPDEFSTEILKGIVEISPVRDIVSVRKTGQRSSQVMKRTGTFAAQWVSAPEADSRTETTGLSYGLEEIPTHEIYARVDVSMSDLEDTAFDLEGELNQEFAEQFALAEGLAVIGGVSPHPKKPEGLLDNAAVAIDTDSDIVPTYDGLNAVQTNGKAPYFANGLWIFNLKTLGKLRTMKDGNGQPLWAPMASGAPATVLGSAYKLMQGMPDVATGAKPIAFGDYKRAYRLVDRVALSIKRDEITQAAKAAVVFWARKRLGGQVVVAEAFRILKMA